jgi:cell division protease FtsH
VRKYVRGGAIYLIILALVGGIFLAAFTPKGATSKPVDLGTIVKMVQEGQVKEIAVHGDKVTATLKDGNKLVALKEADVDVVKLLIELGIEPEQMPPILVTEPTLWERIAPWVNILLPLLLFAGLFYFILRQAQGPTNQAFSFGKSRARMVAGNRPSVTFDDVAGEDEAKEELQEVVEFLREPQKFLELGARIPKGVLMVGPPGTGKTLMAKAVAGEAGVPFFSISGSEFVEMFVGVGASRVRDLFDQAKKRAPSIIFIDEIDAVGRHRGAGLGGSHDEREQTLNQILVEMDGFETDTSVIVIAATNRPDILDPALLRPGRFDRRVVLDRPDIKGREAILRVHVRGKPLAPDVDLSVLAKSTPGFVGADLENLVNEAAILAARRGKRQIWMEEFTEAIERVIAGPERKSRLISEKEKRIIAYHEAGHALVMRATPHADPVHKITIVSRGMALGYTMPLPEQDRVLQSRERLRDELAGLLGGRAAEEIVFGESEITTGASNDLERVTKIAREMVTRFGMSEKLGPLTFGKKEEMVFLGKELAEHRNYSDEVARAIDLEVRKLVTESYQRAKYILTKYRDRLDLVAKQLMEKETLTREEFEALVGDIELVPANATA